jgi:DNA-3-methyladenine glycosylase
MKKLQKDFYLRDNVLEISRELLGKHLCTKIGNRLVTAVITETEAYAGVSDKASHAYSNRRTGRTETMFAEGGVSYVYLCYGIHHLFNIVTNNKEIPHAILVRAVQPTEGIETILKRRKQKTMHSKIAAGPGTVSQALGIKTSHNGIDLTGDTIWLEDRGVVIKDIISGPRVGIDYAEEDALLPYRFRVR